MAVGSELRRDREECHEERRVSAAASVCMRRRCTSLHTLEHTLPL